MRRPAPGLALLSVLLLLTAMLVLAVTAQQLVLLGALTTRNQLTLAEADANLHSRTTLGLLLLEQQLSAGGTLPALPDLPADLDYSRLGPQHARLRVQGTSPALARELTIALNGTHLSIIGSH